MATVTPGTGATIKSTTAEGQLIEALILAKISEQDTALNPQNKNFITSASDNYLTKFFTFNASFPVNQSIDEIGKIAYSAPNYFNNLPFTPGSNGTFKSENLPAYIIELVIYIQNLENIIAKNPQGADNINGNFDTNGVVFSCSGNIPILVEQDSSGRTLISANPYLL